MPDGIPTTAPTTRTIDWAALVRDAWGDEWHKKEEVYVFGNKRKFVDSGPEAGIYTKAP